MSWAELFAWAAAHHGIVTQDDAVRCGLRASTFVHRVTREGWPHPHQGVWALPGSADTPLRDCAAALAAAEPHAALARRSAAFLWDLRASCPRPEVLVPHGAGRPRRGALVTLQSRSFHAGQVTSVHGLAVTTVARTLGDLASVTSFDRLAETVIRARQRGLVDLADLAAQVAVMRKARGIQRLREVVNVLSEGRVDSMLEHDVRVGLANARLPAPAAEPVWLGSGPGSVQIDIAWPQLRVGVEVDGFAYHHTAEDLARDHRKANVLAAAGWTLLRVGYLRWRTDRAGFIAEVRLVLTAADALCADSGVKCLRSG